MFFLSLKLHLHVSLLLHFTETVDSDLGLMLLGQGWLLLIERSGLLRAHIATHSFAAVHVEVRGFHNWNNLLLVLLVHLDHLLLIVGGFLFTELFSLLDLHVVVHWVLGKDLLTSHVKACEEQVSLHSGHHVVRFLRDQITGFHLEVLLVLALGLFDVVAQRLLLDASTNHSFLVIGELLVRLRLRAGHVFIVGYITGIEVILPVLSVAQR